MDITPRFIRFRDAPAYLGMDRNRFNKEVRHLLTEIPIGEHGVAFDRLDLDKWADNYKQRNGRPGAVKGEQQWEQKECRASVKGTGSGISRNRSGASVSFAKALEHVTTKKPNAT